MSKCECNYHLGMGPNLKCPIHGEVNYNQITQKQETASQVETIIKWPRGKYNGRRIVGVCVKFKLDLLTWYWKPIISFGHMKYAHWLCFRFYFETNYE